MVAVPLAAFWAMPAGLIGLMLMPGESGERITV
jgi:hypothetical protein